MRYLIFLVPIVVSTILLAANHFAQPPDNLKPKIFVIGLSRTGTTSIGNALALLGYKRLGWRDIRSPHLIHSFINGNLEPLYEQTRFYDAFEDLPWPYLYETLAEMYPDSKFILSLRRDEQIWLRSMRRHLIRADWRPAAHFYGAQSVDGHEETVLAAYRNHTASVRAFFANKQDRYSEIVIEDGDANWKTLCAIAECPHDQIPAVDFPKSNTAGEWEHNVFIYAHRAWTWTISSMERVSMYLYYEHGSPLLRLVLEKLWQAVSTIELACSDLYFKLVTQNQRPLPLVQAEIPVRYGIHD